MQHNLFGGHEATTFGDFERDKSFYHNENTPWDTLFTLRKYLKP